MYKVWSPYGFSWYDDPIKIVRFTSRGIDRTWVKSANAGCFATEFDNIQLAPNHTLIHIAPTADYEKYSCNVNGDAFERHENIARHHTFLKGAAFREHDHDDVSRSFGQPVASAYNDAVNRTEILVDVDNTKNASVIENLEAGRMVKWSMSCRVPYDICNVPGCGNKATSRVGPCDQSADIPSPGYCKHASNQLGAILKNGHRVAVLNYKPTFFDISQVGMPAEVLAISLGFRKAASAGESTPVPYGMSGTELAYTLGLDKPLYIEASLPSDFALKLAMARKMAEMEKEVHGEVGYKDIAAGVPESGATVIKKLRDNKVDVNKAMCALRKKNAMMSLDQFVYLTGITSEEKLASARKLLPNLFTYLNSKSLLSDVANDGTFDTYSGFDKNASAIAEELAPRLSLDNTHVIRRMMTAPTVIFPAAISGVEVDAETENVLRKYAAYQLSELVAAKNASNSQPVLTVLMRIVNCK